jgi:electron transport complex protein RnfC
MSIPGGFNPQPPRPAWGVRPMPRKLASLRLEIETAPCPERVVIPIHQCLGLDAYPIVKPGQSVLTGEPIATTEPGTDHEFGPKVHSSLSGTVVAIENHAIAGSTHAADLCVIVDSNGRDALFKGYEDLPPPESMSAKKLREWIAEAGIVGLGGALFSTARKLNNTDAVSTLILNGAECEPYITCDEMLLRERSETVVRGAQIMMQALGAPQTVITVESDMPEARVAIHKAIEASGTDNIHISVVTAKYPAGGERQIIQLVMDREVPEAGLPADIGLVCHNVATAAAVADFFEHGRPLISRVVTITGKAIPHPRNYNVRIGTLIADLFNLLGDVDETASRLVMGGPMMGIALQDDQVPITKATNCLIAMLAREANPPQPEMPCIRCGECSQVCPAQILPQELLVACKEHNMTSLHELGLNACIECGCCDYVCPSQIPLTARFAATKKETAAYDREMQDAARARQRFEAKQQRNHRQTQDRDSELDQQLKDATNPNSIDAILDRVRAQRDDNTDDRQTDQATMTRPDRKNS